MSYAEQQNDLLKRLQAAIQSWWVLYSADPGNQVLGTLDVLQNDLLNLRRVRWYSIRSADDAEALWANYVDKQNLEGEVRNGVFDFYMNGATYLWLSTPAVDAHISQLIKHITVNLSWVSRSPAVPETVREYAADVESLEILLTNNHWILFMVLLTITPLDQ